MAVELVVFPMSLVGYCAVLVVKFTETMHFILFPLTLEVPSIFEVKNTVPILFSICLVALITASLWDILFYILKF